jgi:hypothetical protein
MIVSLESRHKGRIYNHYVYFREQQIFRSSMRDERISRLQTNLQCDATRVPKIILQRVDEMWPAVKESVVSTLYIFFFMMSKFILQSVVIHLAELCFRLQWLG